MKGPHDAILGFYMNPFASGIAKFNTILAERLEVPYRPVFEVDPASLRFPVLSFKAIELDGYQLEQLSVWLDAMKAGGRRFAFYFHVYSDLPIEHKIVDMADAVYCSNAEIFDELGDLSTRCHLVHCPGTLLEEGLFVPTELTVFTFGMAHKIRAQRYLKLRDLLDATGKTYSIYMSTAMHQSVDFSESLRSASIEMKGIFGDRIHPLGYLSDVAVANYLHSCTYLAAFFERGIRANNTSVNAALQSGAVVITNLDEHSPACMQHGVNVLDINQSGPLPTDPHTIKEISVNARKIGLGDLGWDGLVEKIVAGV